MQTTIPRLLAEAVRRDPATPLLTWYDDATGDRTELSGATLDNWVSKTANMLIDGLGLGVGDSIAVLLPPHWQTAAIVLGATAAGVTVNLDDRPTAVDALFTAPALAARAAGWPSADRYVTGLLPFAMPLRELPPGFVDYVTEVRNFGDYFGGSGVSADDQALAGLDELSHRAVLEAATARAAELGLTEGARVLIDTGAHPDPIDWLFAPLAAGASTVLCANLDRSKTAGRAESEKVTVLLA